MIGLEQGDGYRLLVLGPGSRTPPCLSLSGRSAHSAAKDAAEEIREVAPKHAVQVTNVHPLPLPLAGGVIGEPIFPVEIVLPAALLPARIAFAKLVKAGALFRVAQNFVSLIDIFKLFLSFFIPRVLVRVIFHG